MGPLERQVNGWLADKSLVLETALNLVKKCLVIGKAGNVSRRVPGPEGRDLVLITPASEYYDTLAVEDIPVVDMDGRPVEGRLRPSSETRLHVAIYLARQDVCAIVHTHSSCASALAVAGLGIPAILDEEVAFLGGDIRVAQYAPSGSGELARNAVVALGDRNAVLLANHGAVGVGRSLREAFDASEMVEKAAAVYLNALAAGRVNLLSPEGLASAQAVFRRLRAEAGH